ncbi:MAG TPA: potassium channel family protein, partial [Pseudonocardia sp.]|nr:potassium channel family protein [Pseudonocardia sp.]
MPAAAEAPVVSLLQRLAVALGSLFLAALIVWLGGEGYTDNNSDSPISFNDAFYYATVSLSTTGYGDIVPVSPQARLITTLVITPLRLLFLIVLVGTTVELLTERSRQSFRISRWRSRVRDHTIVVGYGTKGRAAVETLLGDG